MTDLSIEREFNIPAERLFDWISSKGKVLQWFGPEDMNVPESKLNFGQTGPWYAVMTNDTVRVKVSGHVTHVDPPRSVGFTWGWHDENGSRGVESHVTLSVIPTKAGARLVLDHRDLDDGEQSARHEQGWVSTFNKLASVIE
ncbi:MAG: SRPBCC domain-containing protein [Rhodobacteraceae bacterium]|nr:SRPBCC domain-containing protein [Paracoccaceae bacterium]